MPGDTVVRVVSVKPLQRVHVRCRELRSQGAATSSEAGSELIICLVQAGEPGKALRVYEDMMGSALGMLGGPDAGAAASSADEQPRKLTRADFEPHKRQSHGSARAAATRGVQNHFAGADAAAFEPPSSSDTATQVNLKQAKQQLEFEVAASVEPPALNQARQVGPITLPSMLGRTDQQHAPAQPQTPPQARQSAERTGLQVAAASNAAAGAVADQRPAIGHPAGTAGAAATPAAPGSSSNVHMQHAEPLSAHAEPSAVSGDVIHRAGSDDGKNDHSARLLAKPTSSRTTPTPLAEHPVGGTVASTGRSRTIGSGSGPSRAAGSGHSTLSKRATIPRAAAVGALLHGFAASGDLDKAMQLYQQMKRDVRGTAQLTMVGKPMWDALIESCCRKRRTELALQV